MPVCPHCIFQPLALNVALPIWVWWHKYFRLLLVMVLSNWRFFFPPKDILVPKITYLLAIQVAKATKLLTKKALKNGSPNSLLKHFYLQLPVKEEHRISRRIYFSPAPSQHFQYLINILWFIIQQQFSRSRFLSKNITAHRATWNT